MPRPFLVPGTQDRARGPPCAAGGPSVGPKRARFEEKSPVRTSSIASALAGGRKWHSRNFVDPTLPTHVARLASAPRRPTVGGRAGSGRARGMEMKGRRPGGARSFASRWVRPKYAPDKKMGRGWAGGMHIHGLPPPHWL
ncbi:hypothetical protein KM043_003837 [Ampulex compressa]|nr:hypothetical protein KM043_003837 [Ampulex compressa]